MKRLSTQLTKIELLRTQLNNSRTVDTNKRKKSKFRGYHRRTKKRKMDLVDRINSELNLVEKIF